MDSPCHNCSEREINCHSKCERYKEFQRRADEKKAGRAGEADFISYKCAVFHKVKKQRGEK